MSCFNDMLREARTKNGLSKMELGGKIGCYSQRITDWETDRLPKPVYLSRIAKALGMDERLLRAVWEECYGRAHTGRERRLLCGECVGKSGHWAHPKGSKRYGRCMKHGVVTERCDWCLDGRINKCL